MSKKSLDVRRTVMIKESIPRKRGNDSDSRIVRAAGIAVIQNPLLGLKDPEFPEYFSLGASIGELIMADLVNLLPSEACAYGKATLIGQSGDPEHGAALMHPTLGKPIRAAIGGGEAIIPSNVKIGAIGESIDVPLSNKDDVWSFDHLDTITVSIGDAPKAEEIMLIIALSTGVRATIAQS